MPILRASSVTPPAAWMASSRPGSRTFFVSSVWWSRYERFLFILRNNSKVFPAARTGQCLGIAFAYNFGGTNFRAWGNKSRSAGQRPAVRSPPGSRGLAPIVWHFIPTLCGRRFPFAACNIRAGRRGRENLRKRHRRLFV